MAGSGSITAILSGTTLQVSGAFEGLRSPATTAQVHQGHQTGVRGPALFDASVSHATSGTITGSFGLSADQVEALKKGEIYIQMHSEKAPEGNLWGWFLR
jgi:hypothetical protein